MPNKSIRVVLDTNLWLSFLITNNTIELDDLLVSGRITLVFSQELLEEFLHVSARPKFRKYFKKDQVEGILSVIKQHAKFVNVRSIIELCRDEKDNFLLSLSVDGEVQYLITGDRDLLELKKVRDTTILTFSDFIIKIQKLID